MHTWDSNERLMGSPKEIPTHTCAPANKSNPSVDEIGTPHYELFEQQEPLFVLGFKPAWPSLLVADVLAPVPPAGHLAWVALILSWCSPFSQP